MVLENILLGLLVRPASGYELKAVFQQSVKHFWSAQLSQIYPALARMEEKRWLRSRSEPSDKGPARRVYRRTAAGTRQLHDWLSAEPVLGTERFAYLGQLFLMGELDDEGRTRAFMVELRQRLRLWLEELESAEAEALAACGPWRDQPTEEFHRMASLRMGLHALAAKVAWCEETIALLDERAEGRS